MLGRIYGTAYTGSSSQKNISAITFAGTVLGQLVFGYTSDKWSRSNSLLLSTVILIVFAALGAGSYGAGGSLQGMFAALTAYRFLVGIGIGGGISCRVRGMQRGFWRTEERHSKPMVHSVHKCHKALSCQSAATAPKHLQPVSNKSAAKALNAYQNALHNESLRQSNWQVFLSNCTHCTRPKQSFLWGTHVASARPRPASSTRATGHT